MYFRHLDGIWSLLKLTVWLSDRIQSCWGLIVIVIVIDCGAYLSVRITTLQTELLVIEAEASFNFD